MDQTCLGLVIYVMWVTIWITVALGFIIQEYKYNCVVKRKAKEKYIFVIWFQVSLQIAFNTDKRATLRHSSCQIMANIWMKKKTQANYLSLKSHEVKHSGLWKHQTIFWWMYPYSKLKFYEDRFVFSHNNRSALCHSMTQSYREGDEHWKDCSRGWHVLQ